MPKRRFANKKWHMLVLMWAYLNGEIKSVFRGNKNLHKRNFYDSKWFFHQKIKFFKQKLFIKRKRKFHFLNLKSNQSIIIIIIVTICCYNDDDNDNLNKIFSHHYDRIKRVHKNSIKISSSLTEKKNYIHLELILFNMKIM